MAPDSGSGSGDRGVKRRQQNDGNGATYRPIPPASDKSLPFVGLRHPNEWIVPDPSKNANEIPTFAPIDRWVRGGLFALWNSLLKPFFLTVTTKTRRLAA